MKLITTLVFSVLVMSYGSAQEIDQRLLSKYSESELTEMQDQNPEKYAMLNYALDNACYISDLPEGKSMQLESIAIENLQNIDFASLGLDIAQQNQYFKIEGQDKMLVVKSEWVLNHEMKK